MVNIKTFNKRQKEILPKIQELEKKEKNFWKTHSDVEGGTPEWKYHDSLLKELYELDPMRLKNHYDSYNSSLYDDDAGFSKKLRLSRLDGLIVTATEEVLGSDWDFLQVSTERKPLTQSDYVMIYKRLGFDDGVEKLLIKCLKNPKEWRNCDEYDVRKLFDADKLREDIKGIKPLMERYKLLYIKAHPDADYGHQGEAPLQHDFRYLLVALGLEDKYSRIMELQKDVEKARKGLSKAQSALKKYR